MNHLVQLARGKFYSKKQRHCYKNGHQRILVCKKLPVHSGDPTPPTPPHPPILSSVLTLSTGPFSHELASGTLPVSLSGWLWPLECWTQSPSSLPSWLPSRNTFKIALPPRLSPPEDQSQNTYFSTGLLLLLPLPHPRIKALIGITLLSPVMLTPPTLPPQPGDATCQATSWPP